MGHVNFGKEIHDRKGLQGSVQLVDNNSTNVLFGGWKIFPLRLDAPMVISGFFQSNSTENVIVSSYPGTYYPSVQALAGSTVPKPAAPRSAPAARR